LTFSTIRPGTGGKAGEIVRGGNVAEATGAGIERGQCRPDSIGLPDAISPPGQVPERVEAGTVCTGRTGVESEWVVNGVVTERPGERERKRVR
jgi:hypothetical protein